VLDCLAFLSIPHDWQLLWQLWLVASHPTMPYTVAVTKDQIRAIRQQLGETTTAFAARFARSGRTVEDWEQGRRNPDPLAVKELQRLAKRLKQRS
jgi:DNA-binding transcriptional regulator YiaG